MKAKGSEQPLPINAACNLGSIDISKFINKDKSTDYNKLQTAIQLGVKFLDSVIDATSFPTPEIQEWSYANRPIGIGIMGLADYFLMKKIAYGSSESLDELSSMLKFLRDISDMESVQIGKERGIPKMCKLLNPPRRNITLTTIPPTGTISILAGCSSGIEPIFSEVMIRTDRTGVYTFENNLAEQPYFRCAVSANGAIEVTWEEHVNILTTAQKYIDSGVSKTINFPNGTHKETIAKAVIMAWKNGAKGIACYRNGSRKQEVLTPKSLKKDKCPKCGEDLVEIDNKKRCLHCKKEDLIENTTSLYD